MKGKIWVALILLLSFACSPRVLVNYMVVSVPEEGSLTLTQYTRDDERVLHPWVGIDSETKIIRWYAPPLIAVSPDGEKVAYVASNNEYNNLYLKILVADEQRFSGHLTVTLWIWVTRPMVNTLRLPNENRITIIFI